MNTVRLVASEVAMLPPPVVVADLTHPGRADRIRQRPLLKRPNIHLAQLCNDLLSRVALLGSKGRPPDGMLL
jgi:hypothetical protein